MIFEDKNCDENIFGIFLFNFNNCFWTGYILFDRQRFQQLDFTVVTRTRLVCNCLANWLEPDIKRVKAHQESNGHQTTQNYIWVGANCTILRQIYEMILSNKLLIHWMTTIEKLFPFFKFRDRVCSLTKKRNRWENIA